MQEIHNLVDNYIGHPKSIARAQFVISDQFNSNVFELEPYIGLQTIEHAIYKSFSAKAEHVEVM